MNFTLMVLAFFIGVLLPVQVGVNVELARHIHSPLLAAFVSFLVGSICLAFCVAVLKTPLPVWNNFFSLPSWSWAGGLIGALVVLGSILAGPKIGALALVSLLLAGQLIASIIIDHYGWLGFSIHKIDFERFLGVILLVGGFFLISKS